jgi:hypothetical protein
VKPSEGIYPFFIDLIDSPHSLNEQEQYYRKLYSSNHLCVDNDFFFQHDVKLSDEQKKILWRGIYHSRNVVNLLNQ